MRLHEVKFSLGALTKQVTELEDWRPFRALHRATCLAQEYVVLLVIVEYEM